MNLSSLKYYRLKSQLRQIEVCAEIGIDMARLSRIENGWLKPREAELEKLALLYNTEIEALKAPIEIFSGSTDK